MTQGKKVIWTEGMFLRPHHFQQAENYTESYVKAWGIAQNTFYWGFNKLKLDYSLLSQGKIAIASAAGIMPDGTPFAFNHAGQAPSPLIIPDNKNNLNVVLALPAQQNGRKTTIFEEKSDSLARYLAYDIEIDDQNEIAVGSTPIQFAQPRFKLMLESELTSDWVAMKLVRVLEKQNDSMLRLDDNYIPPLLSCNAHQTMLGYINDLFGLLQQRSEEMASHILQPDRGGGITGINDFMILQLVNHYIGHLSHAHNVSQSHPEHFFCEWLKFACNLATFSGSRTPGKELPSYDHDDLHTCFSVLITKIREGISIATVDNAIQIELQERAHGIYVAIVHDTSMFKDFGFVLAVNADTSKETLITHYPAQVKIGPVSRIRDLVHLQLSGITLRTMPVAPHYIPYHAGYTYFELDNSGDLWSQIEKSGSFALHIAGEFPGLKMELWAIRGQ